MQKINTADGLFVDGNPSTGLLGTILTSAWLNSVQSELVSILAAAGITVDVSKSDQVATAIKVMLRDQLATAFTSAGTASAYTLTPSPALGTLSANTRYRIKFHTASSGASTLAVSGLTAKSIKQYDSSGAKVAAVIKSGQLADVEYDGGDWVIVDPIPAGMAASSVQTFTATGTLPATVVGGTAIINSASANTQTLPAANSVSAGGRIELMNIGAGLATVSRSGADTITPNGATVTSMALGQGDTLTLESNGNNGWYAVGGSAQLGSSFVFKSSLGVTGWKRYPDQSSPTGYIIRQWGVAACALNTVVTQGWAQQSFDIALPVSFPNVAFPPVASCFNGNSMGEWVVTSHCLNSGLSRIIGGLHAAYVPVSALSVAWVVEGY